MAFNIHPDLWRQGSYQDFKISIIDSGSLIFRCIPDIYFQGPIYYRDLLQKSFISDSQGSLAFLIKKFGGGRRAYFSDTLENTGKELHRGGDSSNKVWFTCEIIRSIHVLESHPDSKLIADMHDGKAVSNESLNILREDLDHIKHITDNNRGIQDMPWGPMPFHDCIEGVVFNSNKDLSSKTIMLFNSNNIRITQISNGLQTIEAKDFNEGLYINSDCSFTWDYSHILDHE